MASIYYLCQPITVLPHNHPGCLFEGEWIGYSLASNVGTGYFGRSYDLLELDEIPEETEISQFGVMSS
jgi:hypothetical protein